MSDTVAYEVIKQGEDTAGVGHRYTVVLGYKVARHVDSSYPSVELKQINWAGFPSSLTTVGEAVLRKVESISAVPHDGKDDSGKPNPGLLFNGCAGALAQVCKVLDGGAKKYAADSWQRVPDGINRYWAAFERHKQEVNLHGLKAVNPDFGLLHLDHMITDLLFVRELMIKEANVTTAN